MFDSRVRRAIDPPLNMIAAQLVKYGMRANLITLLGACLVPIIVIEIVRQDFCVALALIAINRLIDGLDGAVARIGHHASAWGGYCDIVADYLFYVCVPLGFVMADPQQNALAGVLLLAGFMATGITFLAHAVVAKDYGQVTQARGKKSFFYLGGLLEGCETIAFFVAFCLWPQHFALLATIFAGLCYLAGLLRVIETWRLYQQWTRP